MGTESFAAFTQSSVLSPQSYQYPVVTLHSPCTTA
jgi:hypothetical protein